MAVIPLTRLKEGETGIIVEIRGGFGFMRRMESMNFRSGKKIRKLSSLFRRGPVAVQVDNTQLALGFGISISLGFAYYGFLRVGQALGYNGALPPLLAAWMGNLVFLVVGGLLFWKMNR